MPGSLFACIIQKINRTGIFSFRTEATGKEGRHPKMRMISFLRMLGYGLFFGGQYELCRMSSTAATESFKASFDTSIDVFGSEHLHTPSDGDLSRILTNTSSRGFLGCLGSRDCQRRVLKKFPIARADEFKVKKKSAQLCSKLWEMVSFGSGVPFLGAPVA